MAEFQLTKYERARMVGARALQIAMGAPFCVKLNDDDLKRIKYNPVEIAKLELEAGVIPIEVKRDIQEGVVEDISVKEDMKEN